jgi:ABC-type dipeptide/oligopeptide/nickel transport system permease subunit
MHLSAANGAMSASVPQPQRCAVFAVFFGVYHAVLPNRPELRGGVDPGKLDIRNTCVRFTWRCSVITAKTSWANLMGTDNLGRDIANIMQVVKLPHRSLRYWRCLSAPRSASYELFPQVDGI